MCNLSIFQDNTSITSSRVPVPPGKIKNAFLILPGGTGTLEEVIEVLSWKILKLHNKPIIFLNFDNYWSPLIKQFEKIIENKFGNKNLQNQFQVIKNLKQLNKILQSWTK